MMQYFSRSIEIAAEQDVVYGFHTDPSNLARITPPNIKVQILEAGPPEVGTEVKLVERLARMTPDKKVVPLSRSLCPNMSKITLAKLYDSIREPGSVNVVTVPPDIKADAVLSLQKMLDIT